MSSFTAFSTSKARAAFTSKKKPIVLASIIAKKIPSGSRKAANPSCSGPQQCTDDIIIDNTQASRRILIMGSSNFSRNCFHSDSFSGGVSTLLPYLRRFSSTCCEVRPFILLSAIYSIKTDSTYSHVPRRANATAQPPSWLPAHAMPAGHSKERPQRHHGVHRHRATRQPQARSATRP